MEHKEELLPLAFKQAKGIQEKIAELSITPNMAADAIDELVIKLAKAKAEESKKPFTTHLKGMEWYVAKLVEKSTMTSAELLEAQYKEMLPYNSSFDELAAMLDEV